MKATASEHNGNRGNTKHGLYHRQRMLMERGLDAIDGRTTTGRALAKWREDLVRDLGGDISTQQQALLDLAVKSKLLLDSVDAWLLVQPSLINKRKRSLLPVVIQRQALADALARYLAQLGMERRQKQVSLEDYINEKYGGDK